MQNNSNVEEALRRSTKTHNSSNEMLEVVDEKYKYWQNRTLFQFSLCQFFFPLAANIKMDSFIKKGQDFVKSGKVTQEDGKDAYQDFSKGGNFQDNAKKAYSDYQENHKDDKKSESKEASK